MSHQKPSDVYADILARGERDIAGIASNRTRSLPIHHRVREWLLLGGVLRLAFRDILVTGQEHIAEDGGQVLSIGPHPTSFDGPVVQREAQRIATVPVVAHTPMKNFAAGWPIGPMMAARGDVIPFYEEHKHVTLPDKLAARWRTFDGRALDVLTSAVSARRISMVVARGHLQDRGEAGRDGIKTSTRSLIEALAARQSESGHLVTIVPVDIESSSPKKFPFRAELRVTFEQPESPAAFLARFPITR